MPYFCKACAAKTKEKHPRCGSELCECRCHFDWEFRRRKRQELESRRKTSKKEDPPLMPERPPPIKWGLLFILGAVAVAVNALAWLMWPWE